MTVRLACDDEVRHSTGGRWAFEHLAKVLVEHGLRVGEGPSVPTGEARVLDDRLVERGWRVRGTPAVSGDSLQIAVGFAGGATSTLIDREPTEAESFVIERSEGPLCPTLSVVGADERGIIYGLLELADLVENSSDAFAALLGARSGVHSPRTAVRSIARSFSSEVQDLSWFRDENFWDEYLTHLATHRINRFHLALGMQYNYSHDMDVQDTYLTFPYPFLLDVPGFEVQAAGVSDTERQQNLAALQYASRAAAQRGIHFQLGLWNHAYDFLDSPRQRFTFTGITPANHADYCRAALQKLLIQCPDIDGITVRVHYEGGIHEPTHEFWRTVFQGVAAVGRPVQIDMHSKGADDRIIEAARAAGGPLTVSGKFWAEHQGLPYHQASVRKMEEALPPREGLSGVTRAVRRFTRYSYGDFLREDRDYDFIFRIWPGSQRVLLWGDPDQAAAVARATAQVGAQGVELCEPLFFLGRKGGGTFGGRHIYADPDLRLEGDPWRKYAYFYRLWGRLLYDPAADPSAWRRHLEHRHGPAGRHLEKALAAASRVLPVVTTFHSPSASNNMYWPEMYINIPLAKLARSEHYAFDTPPPHTVGAVSPLDPELFLSIDDYVDELLNGKRSGRYTPADAATWLDELARSADDHLEAVGASAVDGSAELRRATIDVAIQSDLGRFYAAKTRAGVAYALYRRTSAIPYLQSSVEHYRAARAAFTAVVERAQRVYVSDLAFGDRVSERGHWADRLPAVVDDLAELEAELAAARASAEGPAASEHPSLTESSPRRPDATLRAPETYIPGETVDVRLEVDGADGAHSAVLHYRRINNGEPWVDTTMGWQDGHFRAEVPASYTDSPYRLQVYVTVHSPDGAAWQFPGLGESLTRQPYLVLRHTSAG